MKVQLKEKYGLYIGVVGQIVPWNFPFLMAAWKLAPNTVWKAPFGHRISPERFA